MAQRSKGGLLVAAVLGVALLVGVVSLLGRLSGSGDASAGAGAGGEVEVATHVTSLRPGVEKDMWRSRASKGGMVGSAGSERNTAPVFMLGNRPVSELVDKPTTSPRMRVYGKVVTDKGAPVLNADVYLELVSIKELQPKGVLAQAVTGTEGDFFFDAPNVPLLQLRARASGFGEQVYMINGTSRLPAEQDEEQRPTLELARLRPFHGRVVDLTSAPLEGARVEVRAGGFFAHFGEPVAVAHTGRDGRFVIPQVPDEYLFLAAMKDGWQPELLAIEDGITSAELVMVPGGATVSGNVVEEGTGLRIRNTSFTVFSKAPGSGYMLPHKTATDDEGRFTLGPVPDGVLVFTYIGDRISKGPTDDIAIENGQSQTDIEVVVHRTRTVKGRVVDVWTSAPLEGVVVKLGQLQGHRDQLTGPDGRFELQALEVEDGEDAGEQVVWFEMSVQKPGYIVAVDFNYAGGNEYKFKEDPSQTEIEKIIPMAPVGYVASRVLGPGGEPVERVVIEARRTDGGTVWTKLGLTDTAGKFRMRIGTPVGGLVVTATLMMETIGTAEVVGVQPGQEAEVEIRVKEEIFERWKAAENDDPLI